LGVETGFDVGASHVVDTHSTRLTLHEGAEAGYYFGAANAWLTVAQAQPERLNERCALLFARPLLRPHTAPLPFSRPGDCHRHRSAARSALALRTAAAAFPAGLPHAGDLLAQLERLRALFKARLAPPPPRWEASRKLTGCAARRPRALSWAWCSATSLAGAAPLAPLPPQASQAPPARLRRAPLPRHATGPSNLSLILLLLTLTCARLAPARAQECAAPGGAYLSGRLHGGLGNQLFIQARVHSLALATQRQAVRYPPAAPSGVHTRAGAYLGTLFAGYRQEVDAPPDYRFEEAPWTRFAT